MARTVILVGGNNHPRRRAVLPGFRSTFFFQRAVTIQRSLLVRLYLWQLCRPPWLRRHARIGRALHRYTIDKSVQEQQTTTRPTSRMTALPPMYLINLEILRRASTYLARCLYTGQRISAKTSIEVGRQPPFWRVKTFEPAVGSNSSGSNRIFRFDRPSYKTGAVGTIPGHTGTPIFYATALNHHNQVARNPSDTHVQAFVLSCQHQCALFWIWKYKTLFQTLFRISMTEENLLPRWSDPPVRVVCR